MEWCRQSGRYGADGDGQAEGLDWESLLWGHSYDVLWDDQRRGVDVRGPGADTAGGKSELIDRSHELHRLRELQLFYISI